MARRRRPGWPVLAVALGASVGGHVAVATLAPARPPPVGVARRGVAPRVELGADETQRAVTLDRARAALLAQARADRAAHRLGLGEFLLAAAAIDARAQGREVDLDGARSRYASRVERLRHDLATAPVARAVPDALGDLHYFGVRGGTLVDLLLDGGGSCEPLSHLVVAALHDLGRGADVALRFYGDDSSGATHLTPIALGDSGAGQHAGIDLLTGRPAVAGGASMAPEDLVEAYARAHGLAPPLPGATAPAGRAGDDGERPLPTLVDGYPPNRDRYPGQRPLFAERALPEPAAAADDTSAVGFARSHATDCALFLGMAILEPPTVELGAADGSAYRVESRRIASDGVLEKLSVMMDSIEGALREPQPPAQRIVSWACLAALGDTASVDFALAGRHDLGSRAVERARRARREGAAFLATIAWDSDEGRRTLDALARDFSGRTWIALVLPGGENVVRRLAERADATDWGQINALAALVVGPTTRAPTLETLRRLPRRDQVDVMHEIFHAHDHMRPWASNFTLDDASGASTAGASEAEFTRAYRVFRALAWRLWEGQRGVDEVIEALDKEAAAQRLPDEWSAILLEYYGRNVLGLMQHRPGGFAVVRRLSVAMASHPHPGLDLFRRRLRDLEEAGRLDPVTLAEAWRLR